MMLIVPSLYPPPKWFLANCNIIQIHPFKKVYVRTTLTSDSSYEIACKAGICYDIQVTLESSGGKRRQNPLLRSPQTSLRCQIRTRGVRRTKPHQILLDFRTDLVHYAVIMLARVPGSRTG